MALIRSPAVRLTTLVTVLSVLFTTSYGGRMLIVGTKTDLGDVKRNKELQELGKYSVEQYNNNNQRNDDVLDFTMVVEAKKQVVSGIKYYLKIWASQNGNYNMFDSVVLVKPWLHSMQLLTFTPSVSHQHALQK